MLSLQDSPSPFQVKTKAKGRQLTYFSKAQKITHFQFPTSSTDSRERKKNKNSPTPTLLPLGKCNRHIF